jgi:hypothetical protein
MPVAPGDVYAGALGNAGNAGSAGGTGCEERIGTKWQNWTQETTGLPPQIEQSGIFA